MEEGNTINAWDKSTAISSAERSKWMEDAQSGDAAVFSLCKLVPSSSASCNPSDCQPTHQVATRKPSSDTSLHPPTCLLTACFLNSLVVRYFITMQTPFVSLISRLCNLCVILNPLLRINRCHRIQQNTFLILSPSYNIMPFLKYFLWKTFSCFSILKLFVRLKTIVLRFIKNIDVDRKHLSFVSFWQVLGSEAAWEQICTRMWFWVDEVFKKTNSNI